MNKEQPLDLRNVMRYFADGVTVVTGISRKGDYFGLTVTAFTSVSLSPPLVLVCIANTASAIHMIKESKKFCINILSADQKVLSERFAYTEESKRFISVKFRLGKTGSPILEGSSGYMDCRLLRSIAAGDHTIFLGKVVDMHSERKMPLIYFDRDYYTLSSEPLHG